ncbi:MAG TPA: hemerythrin domain-containing protein [Acidimicrobiales bacterium]|nr:hemerythrin domain-containing protein [Acidimicrobiales bacterium]
MDAITLLKQDHKTVKGLFRQFEKAGDNAKAKKRQIVDKIIEELSIHAAIEEQYFYPAVREAIEEAEDDVLEGLEEHHVAKWTLHELVTMDPSEERFDAKVTVLIEMVEHHADEEEEAMFPKVRKAVGRKALSELGDIMEKAKATAPTRPRPSAPDTPPNNKAAGGAAGLLEKARASGKKAVRSRR